MHSANKIVLGSQQGHHFGTLRINVRCPVLFAQGSLNFIFKRKRNPAGRL